MRRRTFKRKWQLAMRSPISNDLISGMQASLPAQVFETSYDVIRGRLTPIQWPTIVLEVVNLKLSGDGHIAFSRGYCPWA